MARYANGWMWEEQQHNFSLDEPSSTNKKIATFISLGETLSLSEALKFSDSVACSEMHE